MAKTLQGVIYIYKTKMMKAACGMGLLTVLGLTGLQVNVPIPAYADEVQENNIAKSLGEALADPLQETVESQYPYKAEGYEDFADWTIALKTKIQELQVKISESRNLGYLYDEDVAALDTIEANLNNTFSLVTLGEYENTVVGINEKSAARQAEAAEKKKALEQQRKQQSYSAPSGGGVLTPSSGINWFNGRKETYYNLNMSGVIANAKNMGIAGDYWVRGDGVKMYGNYIIVAAQMNKGTIIDTSLGTGIVLDWCPAGTIDVATVW